jgi:hypothetical protein
LQGDKKVNAWGLWVDANRELGRSDPIPAGPDTKAGKELAKTLNDDDLKHVYNRYLQDNDAFLIKNGHALRHIGGRVNKYLNQAWDGYEYDLTPEEAAKFCD